MRLRDYLHDHAPQLATSAVFAASICGVAAVCGIGPDAVVVVAILCVLCVSLVTSTGYLRERRFYRELDSLSENLEHSWQLPSLIEEPDLRREAVEYRALEVMQRAAADEVSAAERSLAQYREYIEAWVHEVKAPISAASLAVERMGGADAAKVQTDLEKIDRLVGQALWHARAESVESDYAIREVLLARMVRDACKSNARLLIEGGVTIGMTIDERQVVLTDAKWASFVIAQGIVNAEKYGASRISFRAWSEAADTPEGCVVLEIADDGTGIPAEDVPHVFERGFVGANGRRTGSSTGMGLYLAARICEKMGVQIRIGSEEGAGTRLLLSFPQDRRRMELSQRGSRP